MFYKTPNEVMINLSLVTRFEKDTSNNRIIFIILNDHFSVTFNNESSLNAEYDKIIRALKADKMKVII